MTTPLSKDPKVLSKFEVASRGLHEKRNVTLVEPMGFSCVDGSANVGQCHGRVLWAEKTVLRIKLGQERYLEFYTARRKDFPLFEDASPNLFRRLTKSELRAKKKSRPCIYID